MEKVTGIGGIFFRSRNPEELAIWYEKHLGINLVPPNYDDLPWMQEAGPTVFAPFEQDTEYFGDNTKNWMINFRVRNLSKMVEQLQNEGIKVLTHEEELPIGKFARLIDPEGNPIELWEPKE